MVQDRINIFESGLLPLNVISTRLEAKIERWSTGIPEGYSTGFPTLDRYARLIDGELVVFAARPSQGKTALAMQIAEYVAETMRAKAQESGEPSKVVAIFSAEMPDWSLMARIAGIRSGVNVHDLSQGRASQDDIRRFEESVSVLRQLPIWIDDNGGPSTLQMLDQLSQLNDTNEIGLVVFDFLELGGDREKSEEQRLATISHNLKAIAKTLRVPVIAISQLNRSVESRANKMPTLSDLRYSGMIEQLADVVFLIMRPEYYIERSVTITEVEEEDEDGVALVQVAKNRSGPVGLTRLAFLKEEIRFAELSYQSELAP